MTQKDQQELDNIIRVYADLRKRKLEEVRKLEKQWERGGMSYWDRELAIADVYNEIYSSTERVEFAKLAQRTKTDDVFEKYFRASFLRHFLYIEVDATKL